MFTSDNQSDAFIWASTRENLSSRFGNNKCAEQPAQSDQHHCYFLIEKYHIYAWPKWVFNLLTSFCSWGDRLTLSLILSENQMTKQQKHKNNNTSDKAVSRWARCFVSWIGIILCGSICKPLCHSHLFHRKKAEKSPPHYYIGGWAILLFFYETNVCALYS